MTLEERRSRYRAQIIAPAEKRGARNIRIFGSVARGDQRYDSDIDFLVDFEPGHSLLDLTGLWLDLETVLGCKVDPVEQIELIARFSRQGRDAFFSAARGQGWPPVRAHCSGFRKGSFSHAKTQSRQEMREALTVRRSWCSLRLRALA